MPYTISQFASCEAMSLLVKPVVMMVPGVRTNGEAVLMSYVRAPTIPVGFIGWKKDANSVSLLAGAQRESAF